MKKLSLRKQAQMAPKYVLYIETLGFLANRQGLTGIIFTNSVELAMEYSIGFDDPETKLGIWNAELKRKGWAGFKFEAVELEAFKNNQI